LELLAAILRLELSFKLLVVVAQEPQLTQVVQRGPLQVLGQCFKVLMAQQAEEGLAWVVQALRLPEPAVAVVGGCPWRQLLDL
jgi:hypothetical protein